MSEETATEIDPAGLNARLWRVENAVDAIALGHGSSLRVMQAAVVDMVQISRELLAKIEALEAQKVETV